MRGLVGLVLALSVMTALSACAGKPEWVKGGATNREAANDLSDCRRVAQKAIQRDLDIDTDIMSTRGHDWENNSTIDMHRASDAQSDRERTDGIVTGCMEAKGYRPTG